MKKRVATISGIAAVIAASVAYCPSAAAGPDCPGVNDDTPTTAALSGADPLTLQLYRAEAAYSKHANEDGWPTERVVTFWNQCVQPIQNQIAERAKQWAHQAPASDPAPAPAPAAPVAADPSCVLMAGETDGFTPQQMADYINAHAHCNGIDGPVIGSLTPPPASKLSPLDVDCLKLEHDMKAAPDLTTDTGDAVAPRVFGKVVGDSAFSLAVLGALGICGIDAAAFGGG